MAKTAAVAMIRHKGPDLLIEACDWTGSMWVVSGDFSLASLELGDSELGRVIHSALSRRGPAVGDPDKAVLEARQAEAARALGYGNLHAMLQAGLVALSLLDDGSVRARTFQQPGRASKPRLVGPTLELGSGDDPAALAEFARLAMRQLAESGA